LQGGSFWKWKRKKLRARTCENEKEGEKGKTNGVKLVLKKKEEDSEKVRPVRVINPKSRAASSSRRP